MISAIYGLPLATGQCRVIRGCRIEHVCGNPELSAGDDYAYGLRITRTALASLETEVTEPTLFDPEEEAPEGVAEPVHAT